jgi:hypothetical protein
MPLQAHGCWACAPCNARQLHRFRGSVVQWMVQCRWRGTPLPYKARPRARMQDWRRMTVAARSSPDAPKARVGALPWEAKGTLPASPQRAERPAGSERSERSEGRADARPLDKLAQPSQRTPRDSKENLRKRARAKFLSLPLAVDLAELRSPNEKSYRNTIYCASVLVQTPDGKLTGRFCSTRWCLVCNRVRTARLIYAYGPELLT